MVKLQKIRTTMKMVIFDGVSRFRASKIVGIRKQTLLQYLNFYSNLQSKKDLSMILPIEIGRPTYLSDESLSSLSLFTLSMDYCGYPLSKESVIEAMMKLHANEKNLLLSEVQRPTSKTIKKYIGLLPISLRSIRESISVDALRESKATSKYLCDYFDKLEDVLQKFKIQPKNM
jgi:hypothetical protein